MVETIIKRCGAPKGSHNSIRTEFKTGVSVSPETQFKKGFTPWNKGTKKKYVCKTCGIIFSLKGGGSGKFCSRKCMFENKDWLERRSLLRKGKIFPFSFKKGVPRPEARGEKAWNWRGGKYKTERLAQMARAEYRKWRSDVFQRDNWTCQTCEKRGCFLEAHHIKGWAEFPELRFEISNGVTLCRDCHNLTKRGRRKAG